MSRSWNSCAISFVAATVAANLNGATIVSENFNALTAQLAVTSAGAFQTTGGTNVDIVGPSNGFGALCAAPESGNCVDMDGSGGNSQGILQLVTPVILLPGVNYFLSFDLIGSGRGVTTSTLVTFGSYSHTFSLTSGDVSSGIVTNQLVTVATPTTTNLVFTSKTPGEIGAVLDNVSITSSSSSAPEPGTGGLVVLLGFGGLFMRRRLKLRG